MPSWPVRFRLVPNTQFAQSSCCLPNFTMGKKKINESYDVGFVKGEKTSVVNSAVVDHAVLSDENCLQRTIVVGNVSLDASAEDLEKLFQNFGTVETVQVRKFFRQNKEIPKKVYLLADRMTRFDDSHAAYVVFADSPDVLNILREACIQRHLVEFKGKHIRVFPAIVTRSGALRSSVLIANLPFTCTEEDVIPVFLGVAQKLGSRLLNVRLNVDLDTGVCRGTGFVSFPNSSDAEAVMNMAGDIKIKNKVVRISKAQKEKNRLSKTYKRIKKKERKNQWPNARKTIRKFRK